MAQESSLEVAGSDSSAASSRGTRKRVIAEIIKLVRPQPGLTTEELRKSLDSSEFPALRPSYITAEELADAVLKATNHDALVEELKLADDNLCKLIRDLEGFVKAPHILLLVKWQDGIRETLSRCEETQ